MAPRLFIRTTLGALLALAACWSSPPRASAESANEAQRQTSPRVSDLDPRIAADLRSGQPLVAEVIIPLCSNDQVNCGGKYAGQAGSLKANLYWNAAYGAKRFFDNPRYG